jgi:ribonuclease Z
MLSLTFLGTSAARPTVERNVSSIALAREGETVLFECGEGTQRQMMKYGVGFSINEIFFTHFHADHYLGVIGLIRTFGLQNRTEPLHLYGPHGAQRVLSRAVELGTERAGFPIEIHEVTAGEKLERREYAIQVIPVEHVRGAVGYVLREEDRLGRFDPEKARALGVPEGPLWGRIHKGEAVQVETTRGDGTVEQRTITPAELVGAARPGRVVVISGDTRPCQAVVDAATGADLLVHEATFGEEERDRARETMHSTALEAAQVAVAAGVRKLALTHLSARYSAAADILLREAREVFPETVVAKDGFTIDVPFPDGGAT